MANLVFSIAALKRAFSVFSWDRSVPSDFVVSQYLDFYGLRFASAVCHRLGYADVGGYQIALQAWFPKTPRGSLFVLHGYFDHVGLLRHVIEWGLNQGLVVVAFDWPGHGLSSGRTLSIPDFSHYQNVLMGIMAMARLHVPEPWYAVGQSTGAGVLLDLLLQRTPCEEGLNREDNPLELKSSPQQALGTGGVWQRVALLAPLIHVASWSAVTITWQLLHRFQDWVPRNFGLNSHDQNFMNFLQYEDPLQARFVSSAWVGAMIRWSRRIEEAPRSSFSPLVVQGEGDTTVDFEFNLPLLQQKFTEPKVVMLKSARHHLMNESAEIRAELFQTLTHYFFDELTGS